MKQIKTAPVPTLKRLPIYLHYFQQLKKKGRDVVSTSHLAEMLRIDPTQIRKDLGYTGIMGKPRVGFDVNRTITVLEEFLGFRNHTDAVLVGAGNLGRAIMGYMPFVDSGLKIIAAFDNDPALVGTEWSGIPIFAVERMKNLVERMKIRVAILTVPASVAQALCDEMVEAGIRIIWSFAPVRLTIPEGVFVENTQLSSHLAVIKRKIEELI